MLFDQSFINTKLSFYISYYIQNVVHIGHQTLVPTGKRSQIVAAWRPSPRNVGFRLHSFRPTISYQAPQNFPKTTFTFFIYVISWYRLHLETSRVSPIHSDSISIVSRTFLCPYTFLFPIDYFTISLSYLDYDDFAITLSLLHDS